MQLWRSPLRRKQHVILSLGFRHHTSWVIAPLKPSLTHLCVHDISRLPSSGQKIQLPNYGGFTKCSPLLSFVLCLYFFLRLSLTTLKFAPWVVVVCLYGDCLTTHWKFPLEPFFFFQKKMVPETIFLCDALTSWKLCLCQTMLLKIYCYCQSQNRQILDRWRKLSINTMAR